MLDAPRPGGPCGPLLEGPPTTTPAGRLRSEVHEVASLSPESARRLFTLYSRHYDAADPVRFERDLREKDWVVLLKDAINGGIRGFSTQTIFEHADPRGARSRVLFSGDTIIDPEYWGEQELVRGWCRFAGRALAEEPQTPFYWLLISKGYRTYLYLPLFFRDYWPRYEEGADPFRAGLLASVARRRFGACFDAGSGLLRFPASLGQLKPGLAEVPPGRRDDPRVKFFLGRNPRYARGEELVCLAPISLENMRAIAARSLQEGLRLGPLRARFLSGPEGPSGTSSPGRVPRRLARRGLRSAAAC